MADSENQGRPSKKRVILVTDGDTFARRALEMAARRLQLRVISKTAGNPTRLSGIEIVQYVAQTRSDPVLVMFDDNGDVHQAGGEEALRELCTHPDVEVIGALAVASNTRLVRGVGIDFSIDKNCNLVQSGVDKLGNPFPKFLVFGDTVDVLRDLDLPLIVGIGDIGKMHGHDSPERGAPVTTAAITAIIAHHNRKQLAHAVSHGQT